MSKNKKKTDVMVPNGSKAIVTFSAGSNAWKTDSSILIKEDQVEEIAQKIFFSNPFSLAKAKVVEKRLLTN